MNLCVQLLVTLHLLGATLAGVNGRTITCVCSTTHCQIQGTHRCNTTSMCYSQFLDRQDGSNPLVRGCITSKTPLLCENRKPAIADGNWPVLVCCNNDLCNQDAVPTTPPWQAGDVALMENDHSLAATPNKEAIVGQGDRTPRRPSSASRHRIISPIYISVLVVGICSLVVIGVVAVYVLRRHSYFYEAQYGVIERGNYFKGHHRVAQEDPELQFPLPRAANGVYENKIIVNT